MNGLGMGPSVKCPLSGQCSGCPWMGKSSAWQHREKKEELMKNFQQKCDFSPEIVEFSMPIEHGWGLRDYADMTLHRVNGQRRLGLYDWERKEILDILVCPLMSPRLSLWHRKIRDMLPSIQFGHFRIRVAPDGTCGIWLDFPNAVLSYFLNEQRFFRRLMNECVLEIGQKHLRVKEQGQQLHAGSTALYPWFETYLGPEHKAQALYSTVGCFSQPGKIANDLLISRLQKRLHACSSIENWLELGSGTGNFTLPLAETGARVMALEMHPVAILGLKKSLHEANLRERVHIIKANFHQPSKTLEKHWSDLFSEKTGLLVDPPRSGLKGTLDCLEAYSTDCMPLDILYISCFARTLAEDSARLLKLGYQILHLEGIDQFPHSSHCEWLVHFRRG